jgi:predicted enzyme related to lactoylglutathione lyase
MTPAPRPGAVLFAKDVPRVAAFYEGVAGLVVIRVESDHRVLAGEGLELVVHALPAAIAAAVHVDSPPQPRDEAALKLSLPVASLAAARSKAERLGGAVGSRDAEWQGPGYRACDGHDPEGNVVQFREPSLRSRD